ncbi:helix-turn-helix domain-containing protein [Planotetraspora sp. GP83]|uniref:helix-turn-helix domain-containing protein n=1 Tax=Planotetraspora sp. GP83 TaxID=3156264 RepID=UPI0035186E6B
MPDTHKDHLRDAQEMSADEMRVYEVAAALNVDQRPATIKEIAAMADLPEETVRHCLDSLTHCGRLVPKGDTYLLGPHDWGVEH